ncbi:flavodoxin family protein [Rummeliibacillus stabekisii]|uniref:NAD(P)H-dependent oxidoreductase n=1 Tax=Rummeliibacillus stabekisii TaxID=241244 RepID=A0A143HEB8_9BACL|nr:flavodoxin family protein [Rummeliibacillus stabekisii]AMX00085.1 NAD(P)H-dependent oxidoreductase [Rummeliibacillus stabekisii]
MSIVVLYGGSRPNGNTESLTKKVIEGLTVEEIYLNDYVIQPIVDKRHAEEGFQEIDDDYNSIIERILPHNILIFATPIYWYSMSGTMKNFIDRWSQTLKDSHYPDFKKQMSQKSAYVISVGGDEPHLKGLPMIQQFQFIFDFVGVHFAGYILGEGNKPGEIIEDKEALFAAEQLNHKLQILLSE